MNLSVHLQPTYEYTDAKGWMQCDAPDTSKAQEHPRKYEVSINLCFKCCYFHSQEHTDIGIL